MRNLYKPVRYNVSSIQAQQTLGGDCMESNENGIWVEFRDYLRLLEDCKSLQQWKRDADAETLKYDSGDWFASKTLPERIKHIIEANAFSNDQYNELAKQIEQNEESTRSRNNQSDNLGVTEADASSEGKTQEANQGCIWNKNQMSRQYYEANPNWYVSKDIHDEVVAENARLKAEVERLTELNATLSLRYDATNSMLDGCAKEIEEMESEVERLTKAGDLLCRMAGNNQVINRHWKTAKGVQS